MTTIITISKYEAALDRFGGQRTDNIFGNRACLRAYFRLTDKLTAELEVTMIHATANGFHYVHSYENATHLLINTNRAFPLHFFGKGARGSDAFYFQNELAAFLTEGAQTEREVSMTYAEASRLAAEFNHAMMEG